LNRVGVLQVTTNENRFERWFNKGPFHRLILTLALFLVWLLCDSLVAMLIVKRGHAKSEDFFVTSMLSSVYDEHRNIPQIRELLAGHPRIYPAYQERFLADGLLGARLIPNFLTFTPDRWGNETVSAYAANGTFWFMTDEYGFPTVARLGHHYSLRKPADVFRVIMLGGSTVEGVGVESPLESLPSKLQLLLEREPSQTPKKVEVINGGISHFSSDQEYLLLIADLLRFEPDLVIAYDGWNDSHHLPDAIAGAPRTRPFRSASQENNEDRVNASFSVTGSFGLFATVGVGHMLDFFSHFATFRLLNYSIDLVIEHYHGKGNAVNHGPAYKPELSVEAAQIYIENRERMLFVAKQSGFQFASFLQPIIGVDGKTYTATEAQYASPAVKRERESFYRTVRPLLDKLAMANEVSGTFCVADISTKSFSGVTDMVYADTGHLLAYGNELVAQQILRELERCKLLPR
jgi:hypothetical protein